MTLVEAGARRDMGQLDAALRTLELAPLQVQEPAVLGRAPALRLRRHARGRRPGERRAGVVPPHARDRQRGADRRRRARRGAGEEAEAEGLDAAALRGQALLRSSARRTGCCVSRVPASATSGWCAPTTRTAAFLGPYVALVADGVGGAAAGEVASATSAYAVSATALARFGDDPVAVLRRGLAAARGEPAARRPGRRRASRMATTLSVLVCDGQRVILGHVGDSRAYRREGGCCARSAVTTPTSSTCSTPVS